MNPRTPEDARLIFSKIKRTALCLRRTDVVVCPSYIHLSALAKLASRTWVSLGVQDVFWESDGFFTGKVSAAMAKNAGAEYAIVGHSEARKLGDTDDMVALKLEFVLRERMTAIVCVGEKERDRDGRFFEELKGQILASLAHAPRGFLATSTIIAYEPLWTIGRSNFQAMKPREVHETSIFIRKVINDTFGAEASELPILYGGSVAPENAAALVHDGGVEGLLVGRQSLDPTAFSQIMKTVDANYAKR